MQGLRCAGFLWLSLGIARVCFFGRCSAARALRARKINRTVEGVMHAALTAIYGRSQELARLGL